MALCPKCKKAGLDPATGCARCGQRATSRHEGAQAVEVGIAYRRRRYMTKANTPSSMALAGSGMMTTFPIRSNPKEYPVAPNAAPSSVTKSSEAETVPAGAPVVSMCRFNSNETKSLF